MKLNGKGNNRQQNKEIDMEMLHEHRQVITSRKATNDRDEIFFLNWQMSVNTALLSCEQSSI
jgi:hypothetical protein